jgi:hypothetical protein
LRNIKDPNGQLQNILSVRTTWKLTSNPSLANHNDAIAQGENLREVR